MKSLKFKHDQTLSKINIVTISIDESTGHVFEQNNSPGEYELTPKEAKEKINKIIIRSKEDDKDGLR